MITKKYTDLQRLTLSIPLAAGSYEVSVEGTLEGLLCYALGIFTFSEARTLGSCTRLRYIDERIALVREADGLEKLRLIVGL